MIQELQPLQGIYLLLTKVYPNKHKNDLKSVIELNKGGMRKYLEKFVKQDFFELTDSHVLEKLNEDVKKWQAPVPDNIKRKVTLEKFLAFRTKEHIEMLDLGKIRELIPIKNIKLALSMSSFVNFSINDKFRNMHLTIQGCYLQIFLYHHMMHDMRFKAKVDSMQIEMDNPYARQQIRDENRKDQVIGVRYLKEMEVDEWCKHLLENFFPNISGVWADFTHVTHVEILHIIRFCYECGFVDLQDSKTILQLLYRACISLLKLEESWTEKLSSIKKISDTMRANKVTQHFARCREHVACILVQIITLYQDNYFIKNFPKVALSSSEEKIEDFLKDMSFGNYPFFNEAQNNIILFITMNFLSTTVEIGNQKGTNDMTKKAVEKIFLYITSENKDCFIESIKQVTVQDLKYFESKDAISEKIRDNCDSLGYSFRTLLEFLGKGCFDPTSLKMIKNIENHKNYDKYLSQYVSKTPSLPTIIASLCKEINENINDVDFRVGLVKESVPLMFLALADYINEYFKPSKITRDLTKDLFKILYDVCEDNNNAKGQIFKGDGLFHLSKLIEKQNKYAFFFLNKLCETHENIAIFLGRGFFEKIVRVFTDFQSRVLEDIEVAAEDMKGELGKKLSPEIDLDDWALYIILNKLFTKLMERKFINEREKLQSSLAIQEAIFPALDRILFDQFIAELNSTKENKGTQTKILTKELFKDGNETEMVDTLERFEEEKSLNYYDLKVIAMQLCFSSIKAFNMACIDVFSTEVMNSVLPFTERLKNYLKVSSLNKKKDLDPFGLDTEIIRLLRNFTLVPESNILIERNFDPMSEDNQVFDADSTALSDIQIYLSRCGQYTDQLHLREEGQKFVMEGVLPYIYKYATCLLNLTHFEIKKKMKNYYQAKEEREKGLPPTVLSIDVNDVVHNYSIVKKLYDMYRKFSQDLVNLMDRDINNTLFTRQHDDETEIHESNPMEKMEEVKKKKQHNQDKLTKDTENLILYCRKIIHDIEKFYEGGKFQKELNQFKQVDMDEFMESVIKARFQGHSKDEKIIKKMKALNFFIKGYQKAKKEYLTRDESPNLISFFDKNTDNLVGVFASTIDRIYGMTKQQRRNKTPQLCKDTSTNRFWMNQSCFAYIKMLEKLISSSKTARQEFYNFIIQGHNDEEDDDYEVPLEFEDGNEKRKKGRFEQQSSNNNDRERLLGMLMRVQHDILLFLTTSPTQKPIWWNVNMIYQMLCSFFKNLCENNFLQFKEYLGEFSPSTEDSTWNPEYKTCTEIFTEQLQYLLNSSKLAENRETKMVHSDQHERIMPLLLPVINALNELATGPCYTNQKIITSQDTSELFQILTRILNDMDDEYLELKHSALILILSLTEGDDTDIVKGILGKATPSMMMNQIHRIMKKLYAQQLIKNGQFKSEVRRTIADKEKQRIRRREKKLKLAGLSASSENKRKDNKISPAINKKTTILQKVKNITPSNITQEVENSINIRHWEQLYDMYLKKPEFSTGLQFDFVFRMIILWQILTKSSKKHKGRLTEIREEAKKFFRHNDNNASDYQREISSIFFFIIKISVAIEVVDPTGNQIMVYFPRKPECFMLADKDKKVYREECDISDSNTKMLNLLRNFNLFSIQMEGNIRSYRTRPLLYNIVSKDAFAAYNNIAWFLGCILNFLLAYLVIRPGSDNLVPETDGFKFWLNAMGYFHVAFSVICLAMWFTFRYGQRRKLQREGFMFRNPGENPDTFINSIKINVIKGIWQRPTAFNMTLHIIFTLYGIHYSYFVLTLNLLLVVNISRTTKFVIKAITLHADQLILTLIMTLFVIFSYTVLLAQNYYSTLDIDEGLDICKNLYQCFIFTMNWGLRNGGGIGDSMKVEPKGDDFYAKNIYDVTFFILVNVIALNIIFGIIIDTFSQLRDDQHERDIDTRNICFVCGNERSEFSKTNANFEDHIETDHDPWRYVYYVYYMKSKGEDELSGLEYYAWSLFQEFKTDWIPIGDTLFLAGGGEDDEDKLDGIEEAINSLTNKIEKIEDTVGKNYKVSKEIRARMMALMNDSKRNMGANPRPIATSNDRGQMGGTGGRLFGSKKTESSKSVMRKTGFIDV